MFASDHNLNESDQTDEHMYTRQLRLSASAVKKVDDSDEKGVRCGCLKIVAGADWGYAVPRVGPQSLPWSRNTSCIHVYLGQRDDQSTNKAFVVSRVYLHWTTEILKDCPPMR